MLKRILLTCLTLMALAAPLQSAAAPACIMGFKGIPSPHPARFVNGTTGIHLFNWCTSPTGTRVESGLSCGKYGGCALAAARFFSSNLDAGIDGLWDANVLWICTAEKALENSDDGRLCAERLAVRAANELVWFPAQAYFVKANNGRTTRPAVSYKNGVLGTVDIARAPVAVRCIMTRPYKPLDVGTDVRAEWQGGPLEAVTICARE
jgi:hypothetical protein